MKQAIIETVTRNLTHYPAPLNSDGGVRLPETPGYEAVDLSDADAAMIGQENARYSVDANGQLVVTPYVSSDAEIAEADNLGLVKTLALSAVGVTLSNLTTAQVKALLAVLLWKHGAIGAGGVIRPIGDWAK